MIELRIRNKIRPEDLEPKVGKVLGPSDYDAVLTGPARVLMPNGKPLCVYLPGVLKAHSQDEQTYRTLHDLRKLKSNNRGLSSGTVRMKGGGSRTYAAETPSGIIGAVDPMGQQRYCRLTAWTGKNLPEWESLRPLLQAVAGHLQANVPERYNAQMEYVKRTKPEWVVPGTPFTTVTVNNCVDPATEALSRTQGWVTHDRLAVGEEILAYDPATDTTRWEPLRDLFVNERYQGDMVHLSSRGWSALVTPDHRWPVRKLRQGSGANRRPDRSVSVMRTYELPVSGERALIRSARHEAPAEERHSDALVRLVAWYYTEGNWRGNGRSITISQSETANPHHVDAIRRDIKEVGARPISEAPWRGRRWVGRPPGLYVTERRANQHPGVIAWVLTGLDVDEIVRCAPGADKVLSMEFLTALTARQLDMFVETCLQGDGTPERRLMYQHHAGRMDAFMVAAVLAGKGPSVGVNEGQCALNEAFPDIWLSSVKRSPMYYEGAIWCPSVPSGHWVARRHGRTFVTGNTYPTGTHTDKGDLDAGFSTIACLRRGEYTGGRLMFPEYRVAADLHDGDLILIDAHQWHANEAIHCRCGNRLFGLCEDCGAERISVVSYYRSNMVNCGTQDDEARRAEELRSRRGQS